MTRKELNRELEAIWYAIRHNESVIGQLIDAQQAQQKDTNDTTYEAIGELTQIVLGE
jgi:hypothetical protein